ncbi:DUF948 domain-containing protein [Facklamia hominis]
MTIGQIALVIVAIAFAVLVVFLCMSLSKLSGLLDQAKDTVTRVNATLDIVTKDVDNLSIEVEGLLNKTNHLVDDLNGKLGKTDPLFQAIGDVGTSVSELNDSTKKMTSNLVSGVGGGLNRKKKPSTLGRFARAAHSLSKKGRGASPNKETEPSSSPLKEVDSTDHLAEHRSSLAEFTDQLPSTTAGEINLTKEND